jgi:hypothetical protein
MPPGEAAEFDAEVGAVVRDFRNGAGELALDVIASVAWGRPQSPELD